MKNGKANLPVLIGGALLAYALYAHYQETHQPSPTTQPAPKSQPAPKPKPERPKSPCPNCPMQVAEQRSAPRGHAPQLGGIVSPDGTVSAIPLPDPLDWPKNIASRGLGCCGYRSVDYLARLQNVPELVDWPEVMRKDGIGGGAYPQKVEQLLQRYAPEVEHWQDTSKSHAILAASVRSQRGVAVDYSGRDPHYGGRIAHCVTLVAFDEDADWVAILDNNYPELDQIVWMSVKEFDARWGGWAYGLLAVTPGYCRGKCGDETWSFVADNAGQTNYGVLREQGQFSNYAILNGQKSTTEDVIAALGPAMAPIPVQVDHNVHTDGLNLSPLMVALAGGAVLLYHTMSQRKE